MFSTLNMNKGSLKIASIFSIILILSSCGVRKVADSRYETSTVQNDILAYSKKYLGKPYRYSGKGPDAFDCSGFTSFVFRNFGYRLNSSSAGQDRQLPTVAKREDLRIGDLVFFEGGRRNGTVGHVGIVSEILRSGHFRFIHASTTSGVIISSSHEPYYASRYLRGGRVLENPDPTLPEQQKTTSPGPVKQVHAPKITPEVINSTHQTAESKVLTQHDPVKNQPLREPNSKEKKTPEKKNNREAGGTKKNNSEIVLRKSNTSIPSPPLKHTVKMGETLFSISRQYRCTVDQLKAWNPQLSTVLKAGEILIIHTE